jgi:hypothetical protein
MLGLEVVLLAVVAGSAPLCLRMQQLLQCAEQSWGKALTHL